MSTLCWWLKAEKKAYLSWKNNELKVGELKPITSKGDGLLPLLAKALEMEKAESLIDAKLCKEREQGNKVFTQEMRALLKLECTALKDCPGFCTASIAMIASDVYERTVGEHMQISWVPSPGWVLDFLHNDMGLHLRRVTGALTALTKASKVYFFLFTSV